jgi:hypothetical protein
MRYVGNCTTSDYESIRALQESARAVTWADFRVRIPEARRFFEDLGAITEGATDDDIEASPFISFCEGVYRGCPCLFADWSRIEWIWVEVARR